MSNLTFGERLALIRAKKNPIAAAISVEEQAPAASNYTFGDIILNEAQARAPQLALEGKSFVLTGAAGTGKTTTQAAVVQALESTGSFRKHNFKYIGEQDSIAIVAFTKVAVRNIQKALKKNPATEKYAKHCMTIHSLLEFCPEVVERVNEDGEVYETKMFMPQRTAENPLTITHLVIEEASMVGLDLWKLLYDALLNGVQIIYLGDINQLPPVFGKSIMSYALCKLPVIELTHVYRQALDNPIIANAHKILNGEMIESSADGRFTIVSGKSKYKVGQERMALALNDMMFKSYELGDYNEHTDIILIPYNKQAMGTTEMNKKIASWLGFKRGAMVQQVKAGFSTWWLAVGDKVLVEKRAMWIVDIRDNPKYMGGSTQPAGVYSRDGVPLSAVNVDFDAPESEMALAEYENFNLEDVEEDATKRAASHIITCCTANPLEEDYDPNDPDNILIELSSSGDFRNEVFQFGYCMSIHKAQGSEWRKVYIFLHYDHAAFLNRELMYTAITRAREEVVLCAKEDLIQAAISRQKIAGIGLDEKIAFFNGGSLTDLDSVPVVKLSLEALASTMHSGVSENHIEEAIAAEEMLVAAEIANDIREVAKPKFVFGSSNSAEQTEAPKKPKFVFG